MQLSSSPGFASSSSSSAHAQPEHALGHKVWGKVKEGVTSSSESDQSSVVSTKVKQKLDNVLFMDELSNNTTSSSSEGPQSSAWAAPVRVASTQDADAKRRVEREDEDDVQDEHGALTKPSLKDLVANLSEAELLEMVPWIGGQPTSVGSIPHKSGPCVPCAFSQQPNWCEQGLRCDFCHFDHSDDRRRGRHKPCKGKRVRYKKQLDYLKNKVNNDASYNPEVKDLLPTVAESERTAEKLIKHLRQYKAALAAGSPKDDCGKMAL